jgi:hypothetical protein
VCACCIDFASYAGKWQAEWEEESLCDDYYYPTEAEVQTEFTPEFFWFDPFQGVGDQELPQQQGYDVY